MCIRNINKTPMLLYIRGHHIFPANAGFEASLSTHKITGNALQRWKWAEISQLWHCHSAVPINQLFSQAKLLQGRDVWGLLVPILYTFPNFGCVPATESVTKRSQNSRLFNNGASTLFGGSSITSLDYKEKSRKRKTQPLMCGCEVGLCMCMFTLMNVCVLWGVCSHVYASA